MSISSSNAGHGKAPPVNREPEKCAALEYFPLDHLPANTIPYIAEALKAESFYFEQGWDQ